MKVNLRRQLYRVEGVKQTLSERQFFQKLLVIFRSDSLHPWFAPPSAKTSRQCNKWELGGQTRREQLLQKRKGNFGRGNFKTWWNILEFGL